jgi:tetratricopeptide (TPR) repeat protein
VAILLTRLRNIDQRSEAPGDRKCSSGTRNADIQNYLGYAYRNAGNYEKAFAHYERALKLSPRQRGAHEYVGETYLLVGNLAKAEEHLAALKSICLIPCEEYDDLKAAIANYRGKPGSSTVPRPQSY